MKIIEKRKKEMLYFRGGFNLNLKRYFLLLIVIFLGFFSSLQAATITAPNNQTTAPINLAFGDILDLPVTAGTDYFIQHAITGAGNNIIRITPSKRLTVRSGGTLVFTSSSGTTFTTITGAGTWNGLRFQNAGVSQIYYGNLQLISGATFGILFDNTTNTPSPHQIFYTTIGTPTARPSDGISIDTGSPAGFVMPQLFFNTIYATNYPVRVNDTNATPLTPPRISHNYLFSNSSTHLRYFCSAGTPTTMYSELNYFGGGAPTVTPLGGGTIDALPYLLSDPTTTNAGATYGQPFRINGSSGAINGTNVDFFSRGAGSVAFYRLENASLSLAAGSTVFMGRDVTGTNTGGVTFYANSSVFDFTNNGTFNSTGLGVNPNSFDGPRGSIIGTTGSNTTLAYTVVTSGNAIQMNGTAALTINRANIFGNTTGIHLLGTGVPVITSSDIHTNTSNLRNDSATPLTINNIYWGSNPPSANLFSGTGIIDYEPWAASTYTASNYTSNPGTTFQTPATPNSFSPTDNNIIAGSVTQLQMTSSDIGYYNNGILGRMIFGIEIATSPAFGGSVIERFDSLGSLGGNLNAGTMSAGTFSNGVTATYTINSTLTPGTYYWRSLAYDPLGSNSYGSSGGQTSPVVSLATTRNIFIIGAPSISITLNAINLTKGQNPAVNADAGDIIEYVITYANTGTQPANNTQITNVLPTDVRFTGGVTFNISATTTVTTNVHNTLAGGSSVGLDVQAAPPAAGNVVIGWNTTALTAANTPLVVRLEVYLASIPAGGTGTIRYSSQVK